MNEKLVFAQDFERALQGLRKSGIYRHKKYALSDADITLLFSVAFGDPTGIKPSAIAKRLKVTLPAITHKMNKLVDDGYLARRDSKSDHRVTYVLLTEKGQAFVESVQDVYYARIQKLMKHLGEQDTKTLFRILNKINAVGKL
ncbi:MarR family transcriptional regulator [Acholeplasma vituli]|uniref:HTH-type transcriptional regulator SarZ n=1 Tax=Paracholeplasma vituli TaxID=69473 RepID=A0ABT2PW74_9MOLU|nr:MarR family transcriptional regulator [Paracholeplasma vituli]MCU0104671.1 MarR family transcriptional regulator [Paracholeplasma vituli]